MSRIHGHHDWFSKMPDWAAIYCSACRKEYFLKPFDPKKDWPQEKIGFPSDHKW